MKKYFWICAVIIVIILISITIHQNSGKVSGNPIRIGAVYSLTGSASFWAESVKNGSNMAVEEINSNGGVNGRPIEIIYEDSQSNPSTGVSAFQKLVNIDKVNIVLADVWAFLVNPLVPLSESTKTLTVSPTVMDNSVEGTSTYFFTVGHTTSSLKGAIEKFFDTHSSAKTVGIICWNANTWGKAFTQTYEDVVRERGLQVVVKTCSNDFAVDYRTEAIKVKAANPDLILIDGWGDRAVKALKNLGINNPILVDSNLVDGFENGNTIAVSQLNNVYVIDWRANSKFSEKYKSLYGKYPVLEAQNGYEAVRSVVKAMQNNPTNILEGLRKVKYESVDGNIDFTTGSNITPNQAQAKLYTILGKGEYMEVK